MQIDKIFHTFVKIWFGMAETLSDIFERMSQKLQILVEKYNLLRDRCKQLCTEKEELESQILKQKKEIEVLKMQNQYLTIVKSISNDKESLEKGKEMITKLVRDVEKCIEQLDD